MDRTEIRFYKRKEHPSQTQEAKIFEKLEPIRVPEEFVEEYISKKVYWLAFKHGDQSTKVWVADPWDAAYLGMSTKELVRASQTLRARGIPALTDSSEFASAGDLLLQNVAYSSPARGTIGFRPPDQ